MRARRPGIIIDSRSTVREIWCLEPKLVFASTGHEPPYQSRQIIQSSRHPDTAAQPLTSVGVAHEPSDPCDTVWTAHTHVRRMHVLLLWLNRSREPTGLVAAAGPAASCTRLGTGLATRHATRHAHDSSSEGEQATACSEGVDAQPAGTPLLSPTHTVFLEKAFSACT